MFLSEGRCSELQGFNFTQAVRPITAMPVLQINARHCNANEKRSAMENDTTSEYFDVIDLTDICRVHRHMNLQVTINAVNN